MAYTYILRCSDSSYYTGSTKNLDQRLWQHQNGQGANHTKIRLPVQLMYAEYYERIDEAFAREKQIQKWSRKKKEALIEGNFEKLRCLSKSHFDRLSDHTFDRLSDHTLDKLGDHTSERLSSEYDEGRCLSLSNGRCLSLSKAEL